MDSLIVFTEFQVLVCTRPQYVVNYAVLAEHFRVNHTREIKSLKTNAAG